MSDGTAPGNLPGNTPDPNTPPASDPAGQAPPPGVSDPSGSQPFPPGVSAGANNAANDAASTPGGAPAAYVPADPSVPAAREESFGEKLMHSKIARLLVIALIVLGGMYYRYSNSASSAEVGTCMAEDGSTHMKKVECSDAEAKYVVVGKGSGKGNDAEFERVCAAFPNAETGYFEGKRVEETGTILCLAPHKPQ